MKARVILLLLAAVVLVSFSVIGRTAASPKYTSEDDRDRGTLVASDSYQFN